MEQENSQIAANLEEVRRRIELAAARSGRKAEDILLLAVSKTKPEEMIYEAMDAGQAWFGENYVQELAGKEEFFRQHPGALTPHWHMIGHLQRNKVKYIAGKVDLIHSVDSMPLALQIEKEAAKREICIPVLLEVNIAGEDTKWGFTAQTAREAAENILQTLPHVKVRGLMTSAPYTEDPESNRVHFATLKKLLDEMAGEGLFGEEKPELSMGMTGDYEVAIEEGSTIVRVGTGIFGARNNP